MAINSLRTTAAVASSRAFLACVLFRQNVMLVVEVVELLRQLECVLGQRRRFGRRDALLNHLRRLPSRQP